MSSVVVEKTVQCRSSPEALWPIVADTERMNRAIGMGRLSLSEQSDDSAARYRVRTVSGGIPIEYDERPFEWEENRFFRVRRVLHGGIAEELQMQSQLEPLEAGTRVRVRITIVPRTALVVPLVRVSAGGVARRMVREISAMDAELSGGRAAHIETLESHPDRIALERASRALGEQAADDDERALGRRLVELVEKGADTDVGRIRPFELADAWAAERRRVLEACLLGVRAGLLELGWDLVCPSCRTAAERMQSLSDLSGGAHCQLCDIQFDLGLDRAVEATFRPARSIREIDEGPYCIGGPQRTPHVVAQSILPPDGRAELAVPPESGQYRVFVRGGATASLRVVEGGDKRGELRCSGDSLSPRSLELAPGAEVRVVQQDGSERHVKLERRDYADLAVTAHELSTLPRFRRQFAGELLRPGVTLSVARVALLFTDLTNSTALYTAVGDAKAFHVVQEHFDLLRGIVEQHRGVIVKTIGDAVMAAFTREREAITAAAEMHQAFGGFRQRAADAAGTQLKIGVYAGPCYVVTANGILDDFGQSVNLAARLQGAARGGEIVLTEQAANDALERGWLDGLEVGERFSAELKGLATPVRAARIVVDRL